MNGSGRLLATARSAWVIARRDAAGGFRSGTTWFVLAVTTALGAVFFQDAIAGPREARWADWAGNLMMIVLLTVPVLSMRAVAAEKSQGTLEFLLTAPLPAGALVLGKWAAVAWPSLLFLALEALLGFLASLGGSPDPAVFSGAWTALVLTALAASAIALAAGAWAGTPAVAALAGMVPNLLLLFAGWTAPSLPPPWDALVHELSWQPHLASLASGVFDAHHILYFLVLTAGALFLAERQLAGRRWLTR